ncbi:SRPBCC family protein [Actinokineospora xionganensis]|uniref:SRPBCC family protein n=1 Tax=Actinokineospora xionganensis TaxID=2684470 RepID=A0ABR7L1I9_9PSEU|nr:SRPBCC family protein [Actinokineospora xionganensis]MBC6446549.1 SRPBCC family protein [Actinokineospora xionganensis]
MQLDHRFTVPADIGTVWAALMDPERVAPCLPGATLTEYSGTTFAGTVKVKVGPISLLYKGSGEFVETDEDAHRATIKASGKDSRGNGTATATVTVTLVENGVKTDGEVRTDLAITGKPAQFGRGLISEVGAKILTTFADCLAKKLGPDTDAAVDTTVAASTARLSPPGGDPPSASMGSADSPGHGDPEPASIKTDERQAVPEIPTQPTPSRVLRSVPEFEAEPIDLMEIAGHSLKKRLLPAVVAAVVVVLVVILRRRQ